MSQPLVSQAFIFSTSYKTLENPLTPEEKPLAIKGLKALKAYSLMNLIQSQIKLENYLYCLDPKKNPRNFLLESVESENRYMFSFDKTCDQALEELTEKIFETTLNMRIQMGVAFARIHDLGARPHSIRNGKYFVDVNTQPTHIYSELPRLAPLLPDEIEAAREILLSAGQLGVIKFEKFMKERSAQNLTNSPQMSRTSKQDFIYQAHSEAIDKALENYKKILEEFPLAALMTNNILIPPSDADMKIIEVSFQKLKELNCNYLFTQFLKPNLERNKNRINTKILSLNEPQVQDIQDLPRILCSSQMSNPDTAAKWMKIEELQDFIVLTNHAYRHEVFGLESSVFPKAFPYDLEKIPEELLKQKVDQSIELFLETSGANLFSEKQFDPLHSGLNAHNADDYLFLLTYAPAIDRLKRIPQWRKTALVLEKMAKELESDQMWNDLKNAGVLVASGFACHYGISRIPIGKILNRGLKPKLEKLLLSTDKNGKKGINSDLCHLTFGLTGTGYFWHQEKQRFDDSFDGFFSSPFSEQLIGNFDNLEGARFALTLEYMFMIYDVYSMRKLVPNPATLMKSLKRKLFRTQTHYFLPPLKTRGFYESA